MKGAQEKLYDLFGKAFEVEAVALSACSMVLQEAQSVPEIVVLPLGSTVAPFEGARDLMPQTRLWNVEAVKARFFQAKAPVDLLPEQKISRVESADLGIGFCCDEERAAAGIGDGAHCFILLI